VAADTSDDVVDVVVFGAPLLLGAVLGGFFARGFTRTYAVLGVGLIIGVAVVLAAYLSSPPDFEHAKGTEGEQFLGRYWDPALVVILVGVGYVLYLVGVGLGAFTRALADLLWHEGLRRKPKPH
jgi:hypothetical protein